MPDAVDMLYLALAAGVGVALFFAAREFVRGVKIAKQEHDARKTSGEESNHQNDNGDQTKRPHKEATQRPWHEILNVSPTAGLDEIKAAYHRMIALYHPDRVNNLGLELQALAEIHAKEINAAYAMARKIRGL